MKRFLLTLAVIIGLTSFHASADITEVFNSDTGRAWFGITTSATMVETVTTATSTETGITYSYSNAYNGSGLGVYLKGSSGWLSFELPEPTKALKVLTGSSASTQVIIDIYGNGNLIQQGFALNAQKTSFTINLPTEYQAKGTVIKLACGNARNPQFQQITLVSADGVPVQERKTLLTIPFTDLDDHGFTLGSSADPVNVWHLDQNYGLVVKGYVDSQVYTVDTRAVSPVLDFSDVTDPILTFDWTGNYFGSKAAMKEKVHVQVREAGTQEWTTLEIISWPNSSNWVFVTSGEINLSQWAGKRIELCFHYLSGTSTSDTGTLEVKNLVIKGYQTSDAPIISITPPVDEKYYSLSVDCDSSQGSVLISPAAADGRYKEGTAVTITATPKPGYQFNSFVTESSLQTRSIAPDPNFYGKNPLTFVMDNDISLYTYFTQLTYTITPTVRVLTAEGTETNHYYDGSVNMLPNKSTFYYGDTIEFEAVPYSEESVKFLYFIVDGETITDRKFTYTITDKDPEVIAVFQRKKECTVNKAVKLLNNDGTLGDGYYCGSFTSPIASFTYAGNKLTLEVTQKDYYLDSVEFGYFLVNGMKYAENPVTITVGEDDLDIQAVYQYKVSPSKINVKTYSYPNYNSTVESYAKESSTVGSFIVDPQKDEYRFNETVNVKGVPAEGYKVHHIKLIDNYNSAKVSTDVDNVNFTFYSYLTKGFDVNIYFSLKDVPVTCSAWVADEDGNLTERTDLSTSFIDNYQDEYYFQDTIALNGISSNGYSISYFLVNGERVEPNTKINLGVDGADIKAVYEPGKYEFNITNWYTWEKPIEQEVAGIVSLSPDRAYYTYGETVQLTAKAEKYFTFKYYKVNGTTYYENPLNVTIFGPMTVKVYYEEVPEAYLHMEYHELDGSYDFDTKLANIGKLRITRDDEVFTIPGDNWPTWRKGDKLTFEILPNPGYQFDHVEGWNETGEFRTSETKFDFNVLAENNLRFYFTQPDKVRTYSFSTATALYDSGLHTSLTPGTVAGKQPDHDLREGDTVTFTATPAEGFKFNRFEVRVTTDNGNYIRSNTYYSDTFTFTVGKYDEKTNVTAYFEVDMPCIDVSSGGEYTIEDWCQYGELKYSPEPAATYSNRSAYFLPGTEVKVTVESNEKYEDQFRYLHVDGKGTSEKSVTLTMDGNHVVYPVYQYYSYNAGYIQYDSNNGIIDFYPKAWYDSLDFFVDDKYAFSMPGSDKVNIDLHPAFAPGQVQLVRAYHPAARYYDEQRVMTAPKLSVTPKDFSLEAFGSGSLTTYAIQTVMAPTAQLEVEVLNVWMTVEEYLTSLPTLYASAGLAVLPSEIGYRITGIRAFDYYNDAKGNPIKITSAKVAVPSYDEIREMGWENVGAAPTYQLSAETYLGYTLNDKVGTVEFTPAKDAYSYADEVTVTAKPADDYIVRYFTIDGKTYYNNPLTLTVKDDTKIQAYFEEAPEVWFAVSAKELDNGLFFDQDLHNAADLTFTVGSRVVNMPFENQGDQYTFFKLGQKVNVEINPRMGYEFAYALINTENGEQKFTDSTFDFTVSGQENVMTVVVTPSTKNLVYTVKAVTNTFNGNVPGTITTDAPAEGLKPGDVVTFSATPADDFKFRNFTITLGYRGHVSSSYTITDNPGTLTVTEGNCEITIQANFEIDMPKLTPYNNDHFPVESELGMFEISPEPFYNAGDALYFLPGTEVTYTLIPWDWDNSAERTGYMHVDGETVPGHSVTLTMDRDHVVGAIRIENDFGATSYMQYNQETGIIDFHQDAAELDIDCFLNNKYAVTVKGTDSIDINKHKAFEPGEYYNVRAHNLLRGVAERTQIVTAPKFNICTKEVSMAAFGSGNIVVYVVDTIKSSHTYIELEIEQGDPYGDHHSIGWIDPCSYNSYFPSIYTQEGLTILPRELGYWITGMRACYYDYKNYRTLYSKKVEVPTYDYIRDNGWVGVAPIGADADEELYDLNGHRVFTDRSELTPGVYIVRRGSQTSKLIIP